MLSKLVVRNFLSLRHMELDFRRRTLLVGPNMSGKSNLMGCLKFVALALCSGPDSSGRSGLEQTVFQAGGLRELTWKGADDPTITIELVLDSPGASENEPEKIYHYNLVLTGSFQIEDITVQHESLTLETAGNSQLIFEVTNGRGVWLWQGKTSELNVGEPKRSVL
jgi:predicted ATPase